MKKITGLLVSLLSIILLVACSSNSSSSVPADDKEVEKFIMKLNEATKEIRGEYNVPIIPENRKDWAEKEEHPIIWDQFYREIQTDEDYSEMDDIDLFLNFGTGYNGNGDLTGMSLGLEGEAAQDEKEKIGSIYIDSLGLNVDKFHQYSERIDKNWKEALEAGKHQLIYEYIDGYYGVTIMALPMQNNSIVITVRKILE